MTTYSWQPQAPQQWPASLGEERADLEPTLARWHGELIAAYPERTRHLVWDRERVKRLEEAVDAIISRDADCPEHLVAFYRRSLINRLTGLGPLDSLLLDDTITEVMVNGLHTFVEREGRLTGVALDIEDVDEVADLARRIASRAGRELNTEVPLCDALLSDGSRIHCVLPPVAEVPCITIRRSQPRPLQLDDYLEQHSLSRELWEDLVDLVLTRKNIIVAGGASTGKTSLLRLLCDAIGAEERLVTIEDVRELNLSHVNTVRLEAYRHFSVNQLVVNALRMRPDRIIVGEVRGPEAMDLIEAMASGHPGSLCTVHSAGGDLRTIHRLARMALQRAQGFTFESLTAQILDTVDVLVYLVREPSGRRRIDRVTDVHAGTLVDRWWWDGSTFRYRGT